MSTTDFTTPKSTSHRNHSPKPSPTHHHMHHLSFSSGHSTLLHGPSTLLTNLHRHEEEVVINHEARKAKRDAKRSINEEESGRSRASTSTSHSGTTHSPHKSMTVSPEDEAEWATILAARKAATTRSATLDLQKEMEKEREIKEAEEAKEMEEENQRLWN